MSGPNSFTAAATYFCPLQREGGRAPERGGPTQPLPHPLARPWAAAHQRSMVEPFRLRPRGYSSRHTSAPAALPPWLRTKWSHADGNSKAWPLPVDTQPSRGVQRPAPAPPQPGPVYGEGYME